jgi:hypothetical protein
MYFGNILSALRPRAHMLRLCLRAYASQICFRIAYRDLLRKVHYLHTVY